MIFSDVPRAILLDGPTPLQRLTRIEDLTGHGGVYVKRDDCMTLGMGGNKVRSLEFWLGEAIAQGCDVLIVAGKAVSNQCRLAVAAAAKLGLKCIVLHNDDAPPRDEGNLLLSRLMGASIRFLGPIDEDARAVRVAETAASFRQQGMKPYVIGDPVTGALGYAVAALELHQQAVERNIELRHMVIPGSMGATEAGFLFGCALLGAPFIVHVISVEYGLPELEARIATIYRGIVERTGITPGGDHAAWTRFYDAYLGDGYDCPTVESLGAIRTFASQEGLLLENTYTSKPFAGMLDLIGTGDLPRDEAVCALHTGGLPALFTQQDLLGKLS